MGPADTRHSPQVTGSCSAWFVDWQPSLFTECRSTSHTKQLPRTCGHVLGLGRFQWTVT